MLYVGLDVHSRQSSLCILNSGGGTVNQIQVKGPRSQVVDRLRQLDQPFSICYEASCGYGHLYETLRPLAAPRRRGPPRQAAADLSAPSARTTASTRRSWPSCCCWTWSRRCTCRTSTCGPGGR